MLGVNVSGLDAHNRTCDSLANVNQFFQGIALINGTQLITALGAEALYRAEMIAKQADVVAALTLDVLQGTPRAFDYGTHVYTCAEQGWIQRGVCWDSPQN